VRVKLFQLRQLQFFLKFQFFLQFFIIKFVKLQLQQLQLFFKFQFGRELL